MEGSNLEAVIPPKTAAARKQDAYLDKAEAQRRSAKAKLSKVVPEVTSSEVDEKLWKVAVLGDIGVGKSSLIKRFIHNIFSMHYRSTIATDFALKVINWDQSTVVRLQLWDVGGQERFGRMMRVYLRDSEAVVLVWDATRVATFEAIEKYLQTLTTYGYIGPNAEANDGRGVPVIFMRGKTDLLPQLDQPQELVQSQNDQIRAWAKPVQEGGFGLGDSFHIAGTSAKDNSGIDSVFKRLIQLIFRSQDLSQSEEAAKPKEEYNATTFKHTREARRKGLESDAAKQDQKWLWLNYMSIGDKKSSTCVYLNELLPAQVDPRLDPKERDVLNLLQVLDSEETSIPNKLSIFDKTKQRIKEERELLFNVAQRIYDANRNNDRAVVLPEEVKKLPKAAQAIAANYLQNPPAPKDSWCCIL